jgi:hypothetical protein
MSQLKGQIVTLDKSLDGFKADDLAEWRVGEMANVLLAQARDEAPDSPVINAIKDFTPSSDKRWVNRAKVGTIRATLRQVAEALPNGSGQARLRPEEPGGGIMNQQW